MPRSIGDRNDPGPGADGSPHVRNRSARSCARVTSGRSPAAPDSGNCIAHEARPSLLTTPASSGTRPRPPRSRHRGDSATFPPSPQFARPGVEKETPIASRSMCGAHGPRTGQHFRSRHVSRRGLAPAARDPTSQEMPPQGRPGSGERRPCSGDAAIPSAPAGARSTESAPPVNAFGASPAGFAALAPRGEAGPLRQAPGRHAGVPARRSRRRLPSRAHFLHRQASVTFRWPHWSRLWRVAQPVQTKASPPPAERSDCRNREAEAPSRNPVPPLR